MKSIYPLVRIKGLVKQVNVRNKEESEIEVYSVTNSEGFTKSSDYFNKEVFSKNVSNYKVVTANQFAYNPSRINVGSIDYLKIADRVIVSPLYIVFEVTRTIYPGFLLRYLHSDWGKLQIRANTEGAVRDSLKFKGLENIRIPHPPHHDQIRIVHLLTKVEHLITQRKQHIKQLDQLLKNIFLDMFGDPVNNDKGWDKKPLGKLLSNIDSGWSPKCETHPAGKNEWGVLKLGAVTSGSFKPKQNKAMLRGVEPKKQHEIRTGDLLFTRKNTAELVATTCYVFETREQLLMPDLIFRLVISDSLILDPIFLWQLLANKNQQIKVQSFATGAAGSMPNISKANLKSILVPIPPIERQKNFSSIVMKVENLKNQYQQNLIDLEKLYGSFSQNAFKGELDLSNISIDGELAIVDEDNDEDFEYKQAGLESDLDINVSNQMTWGEEYPMSNIKGRGRLIRAYFDGYMSLHDAKDFSIEAFFEYVNFKALDYMDEDDKPFGFNEYELVKNLLFNEIRLNQMKQTRSKVKFTNEDPNDSTKSIEKLKFGNTIQLRSRHGVNK